MTGFSLARLSLVRLTLLRLTLAHVLVLILIAVHIKLLFLMLRMPICSREHPGERGGWSGASELTFYDSINHSFAKGILKEER
jgi:hypothetical protein